MNADYRAGMLAALDTILTRIKKEYGSGQKPQSELQNGMFIAARELEVMILALRNAARTWDNETEKETNEK